MYACSLINCRHQVHVLLKELYGHSYYQDRPT